MRVLFLSHFFYPHIGGVEKHIYLLSRKLIKQGHEITVLTEKFDGKLKNIEVMDQIKIIRFNYPKQKFIGIFYIWYFILKNNYLIKDADIIHIHDVFIWYLPFRFLNFNKKVFTTIHGLEWGNPTKFSGILQKKIAVKLSNKTIGVGKFLEKYIGVKFDLIIYGATSLRQGFGWQSKKKNKIVFVGRLSKDTGILKFLDWLKLHKNLKVEFVGDGELRNECEKYGKVYGFTNPERFIKKAEYFVPGGYLACLEGMSAKCKIKVFWNDELKKDYWQMSPMNKFIEKEDVDGGFTWVKEKSWKNLANEYLRIWKL
ncbi:glycosyltransferase family 4 protein [soil metagenome]